MSELYDAAWRAEKRIAELVAERDRLIRDKEGLLHLVRLWLRDGWEADEARAALANAAMVPTEEQG